MTLIVKMITPLFPLQRCGVGEIIEEKLMFLGRKKVKRR